MDGRSSRCRAREEPANLIETVNTAARPDWGAEFGDARIASGTALAEVRTAEVAAPAEDDTITVAGRTLVVQGEPLADAEQTV